MLGKVKGESQVWSSYIPTLPEAGPASGCSGVRPITKSFAELIFQSLEARCPRKDVSSVPRYLTDSLTSGLLGRPSISPAPDEQLVPPACCGP